MAMRHVPNCVYNRLQQRSDRNDQSREKEHWMDRDAEADCESDQQSRRGWFQNCEQRFSHNASFVDGNVGRLRSRR